MIVIDSNIWMNQEYGYFFESLEWLIKDCSGTITMSRVQFDEITNLKNSPYAKPKSKGARCALSRIESFQKNGMLKFISMDIEAKKHAYADPEIIKFFVDSSKEYAIMTLVSNDSELRIRITEIIKKENQSDFLAIKGKDLFEKVKKYHEDVNFLRANS